MNHSSTDLVYMALGAVLIALCSWITVPAAVPFTMQTFAVFFILSALGGKRGTVTILVYIALGAAGAKLGEYRRLHPGLSRHGTYLLGDHRSSGRDKKDPVPGASPGPGSPLCLWHCLVPSSLHQRPGKYGDPPGSWLVRLSLCDPGPCEAGTCPGSGAAAGKESFSSVIAIKMPAVF